MRSRRSGLQVAQRAHVVQAVGQFDHDDADVLHHGEQHLAEALGLAVFGGEYIELGELGDAIDAARHLVAELLAHLFDGDAGVLHDVVQQAGLHGHHVHPHVGQNVRHHDGMDHVGLAGIAGLALVILAGETEGLLERGEIVLGAVLADLGFQFGVQLLNGVGRMRYGTGFGKTGGLGGHSNSIVAGDPQKDKRGAGRQRDRLPGWITTWPELLLIRIQHDAAAGLVLLLGLLLLGRQGLLRPSRRRS